VDHSHVPLEFPAHNAHKGDAVPVLRIHVGLDLEDETRKVRVFWGYEASVVHVSADSGPDCVLRQLRPFLESVLKFPGQLAVCGGQGQRLQFGGCGPKPGSHGRILRRKKTGKPDALGHPVSGDVVT
jgi:hypothetical protein